MTASRDCTNCGRNNYGDNPCKCVRPLRPEGKKPDAEFWQALATRPDNCTCDYPTTPHRADCHIFRQPHAQNPIVASEDEIAIMLAFMAAHPEIAQEGTNGHN